MMNMYREVEKPPRRTLREIIKDNVEFMKLRIETSSSRRNKMIKTITKEIKTLDVNDVETMKKIHKLVISYELCAAMYGRTVDEEDMKLFVQKLQENGTVQELAEDIKKEMVCYDYAREDRAKKSENQMGEEF